MSIPEKISYHRAVQGYTCLNSMYNQSMKEMFQLNRQVHKFKAAPWDDINFRFLVL